MWLGGAGWWQVSVLCLSEIRQQDDLGIVSLKRQKASGWSVYRILWNGIELDPWVGTGLPLRPQCSQRVKPPGGDHGSWSGNFVSILCFSFFAFRVFQRPQSGLGAFSIPILILSP